jgi:hypothetical protein
LVEKVRFDLDNFVVTEGAKGELAIAATGTGEKLLILQLNPQVTLKAAQELAKSLRLAVASAHLDVIDPFVGLVVPGTPTKQ